MFFEERVTEDPGLWHFWDEFQEGALLVSTTKEDASQDIKQAEEYKKGNGYGKQE